MKWAVGTLALVGLAIVAIASYAFASARGSARPVGFGIERIVDGEGRTMPVGLWYPTAARPRPTTLLGGTLIKVAPDAPVLGRALPLIVISHGNGGGLASHVDLAMDLAAAGFVVAAPMHAGDSFADQSAGRSAKLYSGRAQQVRATLDHVLDRWSGRSHVDPLRIGAFGFSAGGFAVLTLIGGQPDMTLIVSHCAVSHEFICGALRQTGSALLTENADTGTFAADRRIRAAVIAAPGLGFTFARGGLTGVRAPVQLWSGELDDTVPDATNTRVVRDGLGGMAEYHAVPGARHLSFLSPCGLLKPRAICSDAAGFDREAFHAAMNAEVVRFLGNHLGS